MFLACEICGQNRPHLGPTPPVRQPSFQSDVDGNSSIDLTVVSSDFYGGNVVDDIDLAMIDAIDSIIIGSTGLGQNTPLGLSDSGNDRAPRRVQRHSSGGRSSLDLGAEFNRMQGTLIMRDDPANYPSQDGDTKKKKGSSSKIGNKIGNKVEQSVAEEATDVLRDLHSSAAPQEVFQDPAVALTVAPDVAEPSLDGSMDHHQVASSPSPRGKCISPRSTIDCGRFHASCTSDKTLPTANMGSSSSSSCADNTATFGMSQQQPARCLYEGPNENHSRRRNQRREMEMTGPVIHCPVNYGRSDASIVSSIDSSSLESSTVESIPSAVQSRTSQKHPSYWKSGSQVAGLSADSAATRSGERHGSSAVSSHHYRPSRGLSSPRKSPPETAATSMRNLNSPLFRTRPVRAPRMQRGTSLNGVSSVSKPISSAAASSTSSFQSNDEFLPSLAPPPFPILESPNDVDSLSVCAKDIITAEQRASAACSGTSVAKSTLSGRKNSRAVMLNKVRDSDGISSMSLTTATRAQHLQVKQQQQPHPSELLDQALESPRTRKQRTKEENKRRFKVKGGIRAVMASMRSNKANDYNKRKQGDETTATDSVITATVVHSTGLSAEC